MKDSRGNGVDWHCDHCDALLNEQRGFTVLGGTWRCKKCGALNDVSEGNVHNLLDMAAHGIMEFRTEPLDDPDDDDW